MNNVNEIKYHGFWNGESPFSNFYPVKFKVNGTTYNCSEQYFMVKKAEFFEDQETLNELLNPNLTPYEYKKLGRSVKNYDDDKWNSVRESFMEEALYFKFSQNRDLLMLLTEDYKDYVLVEASPFDRIWGIGSSDDEVVSNPELWKGLNLLGKCLMRTRDKLIKSGDFI